jgi:hypothetical protein
MIHDFEDSCTCVFVIVDDILQGLGPVLRRPGSAPDCSDSELITMTLVGECRGWDVETELLSNMQEHTDLFPCIPSQSRFNRRRRNLMFVINLIRRTILGWLDLAQDRQCLIDSLPVPVVQFYLVPSSTGDWRAHGARFGKVPSKNQTIFGYKLHLLVTSGGVILDFELAPANATDLVGFERLSEHTDLDVLGDKAYILGSQTTCKSRPWPSRTSTRPELYRISLSLSILTSVSSFGYWWKLGWKSCKWRVVDGVVTEECGCS